MESGITVLGLSSLIADISAQFLPLRAISALHAHKPLVSGLFERRGGLFGLNPPPLKGKALQPATPDSGNP